MMEQFANLRDGGVQLATQLCASPDWSAFKFDPAEVITLAPIMPNGVPVVLGMIDYLRTRPFPRIQVEPLEVERSSDGVTISAVPLVQQAVIVVDDGVETGTAALAAGRELRANAGSSAGEARPWVILAVPVCPHQAMPDLSRVFDAVFAVHRPMARRSLNWHYRDLDLVTDSQARNLLREYRRPQ